MALLGRIIVILFALFMATAMAGIATAIALLGAELHMIGADPVEHVFFWGTAAFASGVIDEWCGACSFQIALNSSLRISRVG